MPKPALNTDPAAATQPLADLGLAPKTVAIIEARLSTYANLKTDLDMLQRQVEAERDEIGRMLEESGVMNARSANGTSLYWVRGARNRKLDLTKLIAQGVTTAQIEAATVDKPKKDAFTIRLKGDNQAQTDAY